MLDVDAARAVMLGAVGPLLSEQVALMEAYGRVLSEHITARRDQPPFHASAMDGYALRSTDTPGALRVVGEAAAGRAFAGELPARACVRISTGAPLPTGADAVLIQENAQLHGDMLEAIATPALQHLRPRGGDFSDGARVLQKGRRLRAGDTILAASVGCARLQVARRPRILIFGSGDELVTPGALPGPAQIYESGSFGVAAIAHAWGADTVRREPVRDTPDAIRDAIGAGLQAFDLVVLIGGASVGPHDHGRDAARAAGVDIIVERVAVKPGKPTWFAIGPQGALLGLPGNPASALVCARLFLAPLVETMLGAEPLLSVSFENGLLAAPLKSARGRENYHRAALRSDADGRQILYPAQDQDSSLISVLSGADALIRQPADGAALGVGESVPFLRWTLPL